MGSNSLETKEVILAIVWMGIGIIVAIESYKLNIGSALSPDAGLFPFLLGIILILLSSFSLFKNLKIKGKRDNKENVWARINFWALGMVVFIQLLYGFMIEIVGFSLITFFCLFLLFKFAGSVEVVRALIFTFITVISSYILFVIILRIELPSFPWYIFF